MKFPPARYKLSKPLLIFDILGGALAAYLLIISGLALEQGQYQPVGFIASIYIAVWIIVGSVWNYIEIKKQQKREAQKTAERSNS
jgi:hypothetical protein